MAPHPQDHTAIRRLRRIILDLKGYAYDTEHLHNPDWCFKEVSRWGFGSEITCLAGSDDDPTPQFSFEIHDGRIQMPILHPNLREAAANMLLQAIVRKPKETPRQPHPAAPPPAVLDTWDDIASEFAEVSQGRYTVTDAQVMDSDWVMREILRLGYSMTVTFTTPDELIQKRRSNGVMTEDRHAQAMLDEVRVFDGFYTYQLLGHQYASRGAHASPTTPDLQYCLVTALLNVVRLHPCLERYLIQ